MVASVFPANCRIIIHGGELVSILLLCMANYCCTARLVTGTAVPKYCWVLDEVVVRTRSPIRPSIGRKRDGLFGFFDSKSADVRANMIVEFRV